MNKWTFCGEVYDEVPTDLVGFVYVITHTATGKKYVGKKQFWFSSKKKVKGKKRRTKVVTESDWKVYHGSSGELSADIEKFGHPAFTREIIHLCRTKAECSYLELKEQVFRAALIDPMYYNGWIRYRGTRKHLKSLG